MTGLIALIDPQNLASIRVAEKVGMRYEKAVMFEGYTHPDHVYASTRERRLAVSSTSCWRGIGGM